MKLLTFKTNNVQFPKKRVMTFQELKTKFRFIWLLKYTQSILRNFINSIEVMSSQNYKKNNLRNSKSCVWNWKDASFN